jgi:membrane protease YdiL (CAAX protease family)
MSRQLDPFDRLKARYCIAAMGLAWFLPGSTMVLDMLPDAESYWSDLILQYIAHAVMALFIVAAIWWAKIDPKALLGRRPKGADLWPVVKLDVFLFSISNVITTVIFLPVSFLLPSFMQWWLQWINQPSIYLDAEGHWPIAANALSLLSLIVLAPVTEEIFFRGFLLHRFTRKWGSLIGILASSALFGALHPDTLEAGVFGVAMCLLYMHTRSLYVPMYAHGLYNLAVWLFEAYDALTKGVDYYQYDLDQFYSDCWMAPIYALIALLIVDSYVRRSTLKIPKRLPAV